MWGKYTFALIKQGVFSMGVRTPSIHAVDIPTQPCFRLALGKAWYFCQNDMIFCY